MSNNLLTLKSNVQAFITKRSDPNKAGAYADHSKRMSRKEFAEAHGLDKNDAKFDDTYREYLKALHAGQTAIVELMHQNGIPLAAHSVRKDKEGKVIGGSIRWAQAKAPKQSAAAAKLAELEAKNAELVKKLEELAARLPAPKAGK